MGDVVTDVRKFRQGWRGGLPETPCGSGSKLANTRRQRAFITDVVIEFKIKTIVDVGAGDLNWIIHTDLRGASYRAYDLVPRRRIVQPLDLVNQIPPKADLLFCLWVLNHLPAAQAAKAYENIRKSGSKYWLFTDRPTWYADWPPCLRDLPHLKRVELNRKRDAVLLCEVPKW